MLTVVQYPHPVLRMKCEPLLRVDRELRGMIREMFPLMYATKGVGLAANQVGLPYRFFIMNPTGSAEKPEEELVFINPVLQLGSGKPVAGEEGCLSFPGLYSEVERAPKVTIRAYNLAGEEVVKRLTGYPARIVQHEFDHLEGIAFVERLNEEEFDVIHGQLAQMEQTYAQADADESAIREEIERLLALRCRA